MEIGFNTLGEGAINVVSEGGPEEPAIGFSLIRLQAFPRPAVLH